VAWMMASGRRGGTVGEPACCAWAGAPARAAARSASAPRSAGRGARISNELVLGISWGSGRSRVEEAVKA